MSNRPVTIAASGVGGVRWLKSSYSGGSDDAQCVEVADLTVTAHRGIAVRDSKNSDGPALLVDSSSWQSFITAVAGSRPYQVR